MFSTEHIYETKVWLRSHQDAIECLRQAAEKSERLAQYERMMSRIIQAKNNDEIDFKYENIVKGPKFKEMKEYKLFQYSNYLFKKYFKDFDSYTGDFEGLKKIIDNGHEAIKSESS